MKPEKVREGAVSMKSKSAKRSSVEILIAEDSRTQAQELQHLLEEHGYTAVTARDGNEALASAKRRKPTLVISDVIMPELDGYGLCKAIKSDEKLKDIPVILVTTLSDPGDVVRGLECGADNFVRKPYDERYLLSRIESLLMNLELRRNQKMQMGVELNLGGHKYFITSERHQILDLLISTYEQAVLVNDELKLREKELTHSGQVLHGLYRIAEGLNRAISEREVREMALDRAMELPGVRAGWVQISEGNSEFRTIVSRGLPPAMSAPDAFDGDCLCQRKLLSGELDHVTNILECERLGKAKGDTLGLRYHASVPLRLGGSVLGVMNLAGPEEGLFDEEALKVLHGVGNQVAVALERARLHEHMEALVEQRTAALTAEVAERKRAEARIARLNRIYAVLSGINAAIVRLHDRAQLFQEACRIAVEDGQFRLAWIALLDKSAVYSKPLAWAGFEQGLMEKILLTARADVPGGNRPSSRAVRDGAPVVCNNIAADPTMAEIREDALSRGYHSVGAFPLIVGHQAVGVFVLYAAETEFFDAQELRLLLELADNISFALEFIDKKDKVQYLSYYDVLTGLPNRSLFADRLLKVTQAATREKHKVAVLVIDLEKFSLVNDAFGRHVGEELLKEVAKRLLQTVRTADAVGAISAESVARISPVRFAAALGGIKEATDVAHFLEARLFAAMSRPFTVKAVELTVSMKLGVALFPNDGQDGDTLLEHAEAALRNAAASDAKYMFYAPAMNARVAETLVLESKLRRALEREEFILHYQPKVNLSSNLIVGLEALMRWNDPEAGLVPPGKFIPVLEDSGMILQVGQWALKKAASDYERWLAKGLHPPRIAVNVSPHQLRQKDFVDSVQQAIAGSSAELDLEITETVIMREIEENIEKLKAVRKMGLGIAIDDFGTGYSSLAYLAKLPVNLLKIDRAFINTVTSDTDSESIVSTIISLGHSLKIKVIAEGVETEEQAKLLKLLRCDEMQGYFFSKPVPSEQIEALIAS